MSSVDEAFQEIFGYPWGTSFALEDRSHILCEIFGPTKAASILQSNPSRNRKPVVIKKRHTYKAPKQRRMQARDEGVYEDTANSEKLAVSAAKASGVDHVLQSLSEPSKETTVAKTSKDWDQFKEQTGIGSKLEEKADSKDAYLKRQDFLTRVDQRKFELEKNDRNRERAKRGK